MSLVRRIALLLLSGAIVLGAFRWWRAAPGGGGGGTELRIAFTDDLSGLDPRSPRTPPSLTQRMTDALWDELIAFDPRALKPVPRAAAAWEVLDQGRRYVFRLGPGHRWSNGDPVTAEDFLRTVRWLLAKDADHPLVRLLADASRVKQPGVESHDEIAVSAPDARTLEIRLKDPPPDFLPLLAATGWIPLHASAVEAFERGDWSAPDRLVTNGPFRLRHFGSAEIVLEANPHHAGHAGFGRVRLVKTESPLLYPALILAGRADYGDALNFLPPALRSLPEGVLMEHENTASVSTLQFNASHPPLRDARVRRALSLALDRAALAGRFGGGGALPAYSFTPPGQAADGPGRTVIEDLAEARRLLAEAGYPEGRGFPVLRIPVSAGSDMNPLPLYCADQWRSRLGLRVYTPILPREELLARIERGDFDVVHYRWVASPLDFSTLTQQVGAPLPRPFRAVPGDRVDSLVREARGLEGRERLHAMLAAEKELMREMPATPVLLYHRYTLRGAGVAGWRHDIFGRHPLRDFRPAAGREDESE
jgi:ABC-type oligopeptide transport system substrate-binding subunit